MADIKDFKHAIVRQKILDAVRKDLIGPTSDCEQLNEVPTSSYITGLLYPADTDVTEDENYNDVEFTEKNFDADGETLEAGIFEEEEPEDRVKGGFQKPSSIGVSFYVSDDVQKVNAYIKWGKYYAEQVQGEVIDETLEEDAENKKKKKHTIYIREQMNDVVEIDFNLMGRSRQIPLESNGNIYIYVMRMQLDNGYKMVSVYLHNNDKSDGDEKEYAKVMFQVEMLIADDLMSPIFVPEYLCRKVELEDEYYYKGRPVYARGRGCAATWEKKAEEINATAIKSSFIPDYEIPSVSAQIDDMPEHAFSMLQMGSPKKKSEVIQNLRTLTEMYGSWITDALTNDEAMHDDKFKATGQTIIDKCNDANRRMNAIKLLTDWNTIEAKEYAKIAIGRVKTIEQFEKFIQTNASERDVIQKFLEEFPWLLDAKMSKFEREITYTKLLKQKFNDESILPESNRRLDFLCTNSAGVIHVIELKRPRIKLTMKEIQQICEYVEFIETQFPQTQGNVKGFLISDNMTYEPGANKYRKGLEKEGIFIKSYSDLLAEARRYNDDLYKMYEDISMKKNNKSDK